MKNFTKTQLLFLKKINDEINELEQKKRKEEKNAISTSLGSTFISNLVLIPLVMLLKIIFSSSLSLSPHILLSSFLISMVIGTILQYLSILKEIKDLEKKIENLKRESELIEKIKFKD